MNNLGNAYKMNEMNTKIGKKLNDSIINFEYMKFLIFGQNTI